MERLLTTNLNWSKSSEFKVTPIIADPQAFGCNGCRFRESTEIHDMYIGEISTREMYNTMAHGTILDVSQMISRIDKALRMDPPLYIYKLPKAISDHCMCHAVGADNEPVARYLLSRGAICLTETLLYATVRGKSWIIELCTEFKVLSTELIFDAILLGHKRDIYDSKTARKLIDLCKQHVSMTSDNWLFAIQINSPEIDWLCSQCPRPDRWTINPTVPNSLSFIKSVHTMGRLSFRTAAINAARFGNLEALAWIFEHINRVPVVYQWATPERAYIGGRQRILRTIDTREAIDNRRGLLSDSRRGLLSDSRRGLLSDNRRGLLSDSEHDSLRPLEKLFNPIVIVAAMDMATTHDAMNAINSRYSQATRERRMRVLQFVVPRAPRRRGEYIIEHAIKLGDPEVIEFLVNSGYKCNNGIKLAIIANNFTAARLMYDHGFPLSADCMRIAIENCRLHIARWLLSCRCPVSYACVKAAIDLFYIRLLCDMRALGIQLTGDYFRPDQWQSLYLRELIHTDKQSSDSAADDHKIARGDAGIGTRPITGEIMDHDNPVILLDDRYRIACSRLDSMTKILEIYHACPQVKTTEPPISKINTDMRKFELESHELGLALRATPYNIRPGAIFDELFDQVDRHAIAVNVCYDQLIEFHSTLDVSISKRRSIRMMDIAKSSCVPKCDSGDDSDRESVGIASAPRIE